MAALPENTPDVFHASASRLLDALEDSVTGKDRRPAIIADLGDVLEELFVRVITEALGDVVGEPTIDRVTERPLRVWSVLRDLRRRLDGIETRQENMAEALRQLVRAGHEVNALVHEGRDVFLEADLPPESRPRTPDLVVSVLANTIGWAMYHDDGREVRTNPDGAGIIVTTDAETERVGKIATAVLGTLEAIGAVRYGSAPPPGALTGVHAAVAVMAKVMGQAGGMSAAAETYRVELAQELTLELVAAGADLAGVVYTGRD